MEAAWSASHLVMYPLGAARGPAERRRRRDPGPQQRGLIHHNLDAATRPILLVHGIGDNHASFTLLDRALHRRGFETVVPYDYGLLTADVRAAAATLGASVTELARKSGHERVHVIGHSLGGLLARYFVQRQGGDAFVDTLVTLGTPHGGTELARIAPILPLVRQLSPRSAVIKELAEPAPKCRTRFLALSGDLDHLVLPARNARLEHPDLDVTNITVPGVGHLSLPNNRQVADTIARRLSSLDDTRAAPASAPVGAGPAPESSASSPEEGGVKR